MGWGGVADGCVCLWGGGLQAQKFAAHGSQEAGEAVEAIRKAESPEEAARIGRRLERRRRELVSGPSQSAL